MLGTQMDRTKLQAVVNELAKDIKTAVDLNALSRELLKLTVETALSADSKKWTMPIRNWRIALSRFEI